MLAKPAFASNEKKSVWPLADSTPDLLRVMALLIAALEVADTRNGEDDGEDDGPSVEGVSGVALLMLLPYCCCSLGSLEATTARSSCCDM
jgi:hypothetical protein